MDHIGFDNSEVTGYTLANRSTSERSKKYCLPRHGSEGTNSGCEVGWSPLIKNGQHGPYRAQQLAPKWCSTAFHGYRQGILGGQDGSDGVRPGGALE